MNDHHAIEIIEQNDAVVRPGMAVSDAGMNNTFACWLHQVRRLQDEAPSGFLDGNPNAKEPEIEELNDAAVRPGTAVSDAGTNDTFACWLHQVRRLQDEAPSGFLDGNPNAKEPEIEELNDATVRTYRVESNAGMNDSPARWLDRVARLLEDAPRGVLAGISPCTIFRIPQPLRGINRKAEEPEIVALGPYHKDQPQVLTFEKLKPLFLEKFLHRTQSNLEHLKGVVAREESSVRSRYSEHVDMTSGEFVQMMLQDCCFVLELLLCFFKGDDATEEEDNPIFTRPQIIPILIMDLLKLENQIPYSLLESLFAASGSSKLIGKTDSLATVALKLFNQAYPRPMTRLKSWSTIECEHLLDLFYSSLSPTSGVQPNYPKENWPSAQSVPCVTELRPSGIRFKSRKADSLLDITFQKPFLHIPQIAINDFMTTVLINCVSLEQCREDRSKYITDYVSFMHCLINQPKDVWLLRSDGIIALFSHDDRYVAKLFDKLGESISFNVHDCFLSEQFEALESYFHSNWANMMRTYFSSPWSFISAFSALLVIVLSATQTVFAVLTYRYHH